MLTAWLEQQAGDTVHGKNAYLVTLAEQHSRLLLMGKLPDKKAATVSACLSQLL